MKEMIVLKNEDSKSKSNRVVVRHTDKNGVIIKEIFGFDKKVKPQKEEEDFEVTEEMQEILDEFDKKHGKDKNDREN